MMNSKIVAHIDPVDMAKLNRISKRAGLNANEAARIIYTKGLRFFLNSLVGATNR